jgi:hypothetical protein
MTKLKRASQIILYLALYVPAVIATEFSEWFWRWDLETFGF